MSESDWIHLNPGFSGIYIVKYTDDNRAKILESVKSSFPAECISAESRCSLIFDMVRMCASGECSSTELLDCLGHFADEPNSLVWKMIVGALTRVQILVLGTKSDEEKFKSFKLKLMSKKAKELGFGPKNEGLVDRIEVQINPSIGL